MKGGVSFMSYPYIKNTLIALLFLVEALVIIWFKGPIILSLIGGIIGFLIFSWNFKKIVAPIIFLLIFLLPIGLSSLSGIRTPYLSFRHFYPSLFSKGVDFSHVELPKKSIPSAEFIEIDGPGYLVKFDKEAEDIKIPEGITVKRSGNRLSLEDTSIFKIPGIRFGVKYKAKMIIIGVKNPVDTVEINSMGTKVTGYINTDTLSVDGMGIDIEGTLDLDTLEADGMGIRINAKVIRAQKISIDGMGAYLNLSYIKPWEGTWYLTVQAMGSKVAYSLPDDNPGKLLVEREGLGNVVRHYGD